MRRQKIQELRELCEAVHEHCCYPEIPWSPNRRCVHLEAVEGDEAVFSTYAAYHESWGKMAGTFRLPLAECTRIKLEEETEFTIGFSKEVDRPVLTSLREDVGLHASPTHPVTGATPEFRAIPVESFGSQDGLAYSGTDRGQSATGFQHLPANPTKESGDDGEISRTNIHNVAIPEAALRIEKREEKKLYCPHCKEEIHEKALFSVGVNSKEWGHRGPCATKGMFHIPKGYFTEWGTAGTIDPSQLPKIESWLQAFKDSLSEDEARGTRKYQHAIAVIVKNRREILLGKAKSDDDRNGKWCFPGGHIDPGDGGDPVAAAIREAQEEAGIIVTSKGEILEHPDKPGCAFVVCFYADRLEPRPNPEFSEFTWLTHATRHNSGLDIYSPNDEVMDHLLMRAMLETLDDLGISEASRDDLRAILGETTALKRQDQNKRAWAVSANDRRVTTGVAAEPARRSIAGSSDHTQDDPSDQSVAATQGIKGKHTLSSPSAPQDSAEKLHFTGAKSPRAAAAAAGEEMERQKQGRDPASLKPGDAGTAGVADAAKEAKQGAAPQGPPAQAAAAPGQVPAAAPMQAPMQPGQAPGAPPAPGQAPGGAPAGNPPMKPGEAPTPPLAGQAALPPAAQPTQPPPPGAAPGEVGQPAPGNEQAQKAAMKPAQAPQQGQQPGQAPGQPPQAGAGGPAQQMQQGAQQPGQPGQPQQPGMAGQQPGLAPGMTPPMMQPTGMPAFAPRTVDLVLQDRGNADKCFKWLQALGFQPVTPDFTTVQIVVNTHEEMHLVGRTAKAFGLEMSGIIPR